MKVILKCYHIGSYFSFIGVVVQVCKTVKVGKRCFKVHDILVLRFIIKNQCMWSFNKFK